MFSTQSLLSFVLLAVSLGSVSATPVVRVESSTVTLPVASKFNFNFNSTASVSIADIDRSRAHALVQNAQAKKAGKRASSFPVTNGVVTYSADVGVGSPATTYSLIIDTGSSNTWVGADKKYVKTSTSTSTGHSVSVSYGSGSFSGTEYTDQVTLSSDLVIQKQSIGVASKSTGFDGTDGILGVGPVDLTSGTVASTSTVPTVVDNLFSQGTISSKVLGIYYAPATQDSEANGELTFGGVDTSKTTGTVAYTSLTKTSPASEYWGINQSITYGTTSILSSTAGIVDTGTTLTLIASDAFKKYQKATGATLDNNTGLLKITSAQYAKLQDLNFKVGSNTYSLTPNAQIWPRSLNTAIGGSSSSIYLIVADLGSNSGEGLDFINGYTFLERFYSVFDTTNSRVGFATTAHTTDTSN